MQLISFFAILLISFVIGGSIVASGQVFLAIREIALNTRNGEDEKNGKPKYGMLETMARINNFLGWIIIIFGLILAVFVVQSSNVGPSFYRF
jgi:hypothetical protein